MAPGFANVVIVKVLVIEDDPDFRGVVLDAVGSEFGDDVEVSIAASRTSALALLQSAWFDLVVCDLVIPTADLELDQNISHGLAVLNRTREECPGTPVIVFSAFGRDILETEILPLVTQDDPFGSGHLTPMVTYVDKGNIRRWLDELRLALAGLTSLQETTVRTDEALTEEEERLFAIVGHRFGAVDVECTASPGLSGSRTFRVAARETSGAPVIRGIAKIDRISVIRGQQDRYVAIVAARLGAGTFAPLTTAVTAGPPRQGLALYAVADDAVSLFEFLVREPDAAERVVKTLARNELPWREARVERRIRVGDVRRLFVDDVEWNRLRQDVLTDVDWRAAEEREIDVYACPQHGDMHGGNALVLPSGEPILIDYGRCGQFPASTDALTLELSLAYHPDGRDTFGDPAWVSECDWAALAEDAETSPSLGLSRTCRVWAREAARSDEEILAVRYALSAWQLSFDASSEPARHVIRQTTAALANA